MPCGWEGNHRSGVALAMCQRLSGLSIYGLIGHRKGDEHHADAPCGVQHPLPTLPILHLVSFNMPFYIASVY